jgi:ankyrin repeat protein
MKKIILSMTLVVGFALSASSTTINDSNESANYENVSMLNTEVSTFCKLIAKGDIDAVKSMIAAGADINQKSVGMTPLMYAARHNRVEIVNLLISKGANLKVKSNRGYSALDYAEMSKAVDAYKVISDVLYSKIKKKKASL